MANPAEPFESLSIPRKDMPQLQASRYRIYTDHAHFKVVEAVSALEALQMSGIKHAYRIQRDALYLNNVLKIETLSGEIIPDEMPVTEVIAVAAVPQKPPVAPVPEAVEKPVEAPVPVAKSAAPVAPASDAPLSNDDIDKLLNG